MDYLLLHLMFVFLDVYHLFHMMLDLRLLLMTFALLLISFFGIFLLGSIADLVV